MKRGIYREQYFRLWMDQWLWGWTRDQLIVEKKSQRYDLRGIWLDLLCLALMDEGFIRQNETTPYRLERLAGFLWVPLGSLEETIAICLKVGKLKEFDEGIYRVVDYKDYESMPIKEDEVRSGEYL